MNKEVRLLLKARDAALKSGDREAYSLSRSNLKRGIQSAKYNYKLHIEDRFKNNDPRRMWTGIHALTDYKPANNTPPNSNATLPDELNNFYARFDRGNTDPPIKALLTPDNLPLTLSTSDVCATLRKVNSHKAAGPDGIPGRVLRACAEQLAEVFTNIFTFTFTFNHLADAFIQSDVQMRRTIEAIRPSREQQYTSALTSLS